jgi:hypothetical protein
MTKTLSRKPLAAMAALSLFAVAAPAAAQSPAAAKARTTAVVAQLNTPATPITEAEVREAHRAWGDALVAISTEYDRNGHAAAKRMAERVIDTAYGYDLGPVLFKPTLTQAPQTFRTTRDGALAYFVGGDQKYPGDTGFALKSWRGYEMDKVAVLINGGSALSMGNVTVIDAKGARTTVDKTWGYVRGPDGKLRIVLHHSSLPYKAS